MKTFTLILISIFTWAKTDLVALSSGVANPGDDQITQQSKSNTQSPAKGIIVGFKTSKTGAAKAVNTDAFKEVNRKGFAFQLLDPDNRIFPGGEKRIQFTESTGQVIVDLIGLNVAGGKPFRLRVTDGTKNSTIIDLK